MSLLTVEGLAVSYGAVRAVRDVGLSVEAGEIVTILGANGAGKSSTLNAIMGLVPASAGRVVFDGQEISGWAPERVVKLGMTLTPEGRRVFPRLTVQENLILGAVARRERAGAAAREAAMLERFPILAQRRGQAAGTLSGGEQQQLAIARSLMSEPRLLLLDEPSLGLAPKFVDLIFDLIIQLREEGVTILLVEQNVDRALAISDRGYVLAGGRVELTGPCAELRASSAVESAYLGMGTA
jgi:branched-chain amino acid transport system ATP-binding protein